MTDHNKKEVDRTIDVDRPGDDSQREMDSDSGTDGEPSGSATAALHVPATDGAGLTGGDSFGIPPPGSGTGPAGGQGAQPRHEPHARPAPDKAARGGPDDDAHKSALDGALLRRLWEFLAPYKGAVVGSLALSVVISLLRIAQPALIHNLLDNEVARGDLPGVARKSFVLFGLILTIFGCQTTFDYVTGVIGQKSMHDLRMRTFRHVAGLDVAFFDRNPVGRLVTRMTSDITTLNDLFSNGVIAIFSELLMIAGVFALMLFYNVKLAMVALGALPLMLLVIHVFRQHARRWYLEGRARLARLNSFLQENVAGMKTVQSFNREARNHADFVVLNDEYKASQIQTIYGFAFFYPAMSLISNLTLATVIWVGGRRVLRGAALGDGGLSFATLFLFVQCVQMLFRPLQELSEKYNLLQSAMASSARIFRLLDTTSTVEPPLDAEGRPDAEPTPERLREAIRFENVGFEYIPGEPVLRNINFEIRRGMTVAVVGATGSGKTTLINLLTRFYDATDGRVTIDGVDVRRFDPRGLRRLFAVVLQEVFLFSGTIAGNLRLTRPDLTDEQVWDLLRQVRADDFVAALPGGIDAPVSERGGTLSTGQKQLLAFARALAANPELLILDEATANVDTATEQRIQEAIGRLLRGRTAFVVAHRISTIQRADLILVMHKGRIHESGSHEQLIKIDGLYRRLYELQYRGEAVAGDPAAMNAKNAGSNPT